MAATIALPSSVVAESRTRTRLRLWPEWLTLFLYTSIVAFAIPFHEPWADEAQAWQMARALSIHDLFFHALRYEGSPGLWHLLLHGLIRLHVSYAAMHWLTGLVAVSGMALLIFFAPFPRWVRLSLPFTVFFAFQWAVVARSYVFVPLLTFAAATLWKKNGIAVAVLLGLLANTSLHGFGLALGFAIVYLIEMRRGSHQSENRIVIVSILLLLFGIALFTALPPPPDITFADELVHESAAVRIGAAVPLAVIYLSRAVSYWWLLSIPILPLVLWMTYRIGGALYLLPVLSVAMVAGVGYFTYWHVGFASTATIATAWICWRQFSRPIRIVGSVVFGIWVVVQLSYSAFALTWDHKFLYSPDAAAAEYLRPLVNQKLPLAVTLVNTSDAAEFHSIGLGPYFEHPIFINQTRLYWFWSNQERVDERFKDALNRDPAAIIAMYRSHKGRPFNPAYDLDSRRLHPLYERGYGVTHIFCGARPEAFDLREEICEIVLER